MLRKIIIIGSIFLLFPSYMLAQTTGKIRGKVIDESTGEALPFANVYLEGTTIGGATNLDGEYVILNIPVGTYVVVASVIGYKNVKMENVKISIDVTTPANFKLSPATIKGEEVVVTAQRPIIERDVTASTKRMSGKEITQMPVRDYEQAVASQSGAVETRRSRSGGLHIRGGRSDEVVYIVDGINTTDPVTGTPGAIVDNNAISEMLVIKGGFDAEYGKAMSGVVNIVTTEGSIKSSGTLKYTTDAIFKRKEDHNYNVIKYAGHNMLAVDTFPGQDSLINSSSMFSQGYNFGYNDVALTYGGPVFKSKKLSFFTSLGYEDYRYPYLPHSDRTEQRATGKLTWKMSNAIKTTLSGNYAYREGHMFSQSASRGAWLEDAPFYNQGNSQINLRLNHTINAKTFYNINVGRFNTYYNQGSQVEVEDSSFFGKLFNRHNCKDYHEFKGIGTYLPWVSLAYDSGWYNPKTKEWRYGWSAERAWRWYYEDVIGLGHYDVSNGQWVWNPGADASDIRDALANRCYDNGSYLVGADKNSLLDGDTVVCELDDSTFIYYHRFNLDKYIEDVRKYVNGEMSSDSMESSGNLYMIRYNRDEWGTFSYYFSPTWMSRNTTRLSASGQLNSQVNKYNEIKIGGEIEKHDLTLTQIQFINNNPYMDYYNKYPVTAAAYISDKINYEDMNLNIGIRADYFDPRDSFYIHMDSLQAGKEEVEAKYQYSPRFGISYAVSDKAVMFANYGHFFQPLNFSDLYQNLEADITNGWPTIGNPNLPPEKQIMYETGFRYAFTKDLAMDISAYFKDVKTLLTTRQMTTIFNKKLASYTVYELQDFAVIKGLECGITKRANEFLSGTVNYLYQQARGTGSSSEEAFIFYYYSGSTGEPPNREFPLEYDITHTVKTNLNFYLPIGFGPRIAGIKVLSDWNTNLQFVYQSGAPYTPTDSKGAVLEPGSKRMPSTLLSDIKIEKGIMLGGINMNLFAQVNNIFNAKIVTDVYSFTGQADLPGLPSSFDSTYYEGLYQNYLNESDEYKEMYKYENARDMYNDRLAIWHRYYDTPTHYNNPRIIRVGVEFRFY